MRSRHVGSLISQRIRDRRAHSSLGRQVYDDIELALDVSETVRVADVGFDELEMGVSKRPGKIAFLAPALIERIKVVDARNAPALGEQPFAQMAANESGGAGKKNMPCHMELVAGHGI